MNAIDKLIALDKASPKRIAVIGDRMLDVWKLGRQEPSQDGCAKFILHSEQTTPGGSGNAAEQLLNWNSRTEDQALCIRAASFCKKIRYVEMHSGKILFREDRDVYAYGLSSDLLNKQRSDVVAKIGQFDAVLIADYHKGFLNEQTIKDIIKKCNAKNIPVVCDTKRPATWHSGCIVKINNDVIYEDRPGETCVITRGSNSPWIGRGQMITELPKLPPVPCLNHVGAGDCFSAHLTLALAHGLPLIEAVNIAHSAGRVFVQHMLARPPWPHEIRRDLLPVQGKVLSREQVPQLVASFGARKPRLIFANGVFRVPHAGHSWLLQWARQQGDLLIVGVNDDASARRLRSNAFVLPLKERTELLASQQCVDWVIPFEESDPCALLEQLKPDVMVKGHEYADRDVPGAALVSAVAFAPPSPYHSHCTDLIEAMVRAG